MSQKLTLAVYLQGRGKVKSLTRIEAEAFGVAYPLVSGWPDRHGADEITAVMLEDLSQRIRASKRSTAIKALRGLDGAGLSYSEPSGTVKAPKKRNDEPMLEPRVPNSTSFHGFALRPAKRQRRLAHMAKA